MNIQENQFIADYIVTSRLINSWYKGGGTYNKPLFKKWLESLEGLTSEDITRILFQYDDGIIVLKFSAEKFIKEHS